MGQEPWPQLSLRAKDQPKIMNTWNLSEELKRSPTEKSQGQTSVEWNTLWDWAVTPAKRLVKNGMKFVVKNSGQFRASFHEARGTAKFHQKFHGSCHLDFHPQFQKQFSQQHFCKPCRDENHDWNVGAMLGQCLRPRFGGGLPSPGPEILYFVASRDSSGGSRGTGSTCAPSCEVWRSPAQSGEPNTRVAAKVPRTHQSCGEGALGMRVACPICPNSGKISHLGTPTSSQALYDDCHSQGRQNTWISWAQSWNQSQKIARSQSEPHSTVKPPFLRDWQGKIKL